MTAGDIDAALSVDVGAAGYTIPPGATCAIVIAPGAPPTVGTALPPFMTTTIAGPVVTYVTTAATDVPAGGEWTIWAEIRGSGYAFTTPPGTFWVNYAPKFAS